MPIRQHLYLAWAGVVGYHVFGWDHSAYGFLRLACNSEEFSPVMSAPALNQSKRSAGLLLFAALALSIFCSLTHLAAQTALTLEPGPKPQDTPARWKPWIGEYGPDGPLLNTVAEKDGQLILSGKQLGECAVKEISASELRASCHSNSNVRLVEEASGTFFLRTDAWNFTRRDFGVDASHVARIQPVRPVAELRAEALAASPPHEDGTFRKPELVELTTLDPAIHLDIRYATANDFLGTPVYTQARAFMQRPAAEALVRALHKLQPLGYGLLIHDARVTTAAVPPTSRSMILPLASPSKCPAPTTKCLLALSPIIRAALLSNAGTATCSAAPWNPRASPSTNMNGGTSITKTGVNIRF